MMTQSSKTTTKGQRKGKNPNVGVARPPTTSVPSFSVPSAASGAGSEASNDGKISNAAKHEGQDSRQQISIVEVCYKETRRLGQGKGGRECFVNMWLLP
jgi:hypothetical protein